MTISPAVRLAELAETLANLSEKLYAISEELIAPAETPAPPKRDVTAEEVRAALTTLASTKGADAAKKLLADYGAKKLTDMAVQDYPELLAAAERQIHA
jgi:chemotaxis response regulator CheB